MKKNNKIKHNYKHRENFIPSSFSWLNLDEQKERVKDLEDITKINKKIDDKKEF